MANKKKPVPAKPKKPAQAQKKKPEPAKKRIPVSADKKKPEPAQRPARDPIGGEEILRRVMIVVLALLCGCGVALSAVSFHTEQLHKKITLSYSGMQQRECLFDIGFEDGQLREFLRATKRRGETRTFTYFCNSKLRLDVQSKSGYILFGNPDENDCELVLTVLDENGALLYRSGGVLPGQYITQIRPFFDPEGGVHACTAYVAGYKAQDSRYKCVGVQYSRLSVEVGESS